MLCRRSIWFGAQPVMNDNGSAEPLCTAWPASNREPLRVSESAEASVAVMRSAVCEFTPPAALGPVPSAVADERDSSAETSPARVCARSRYSRPFAVSPVANDSATFSFARLSE